jgi:hypothetical protein
LNKCLSTNVAVLIYAGSYTKHSISRFPSHLNFFVGDDVGEDGGRFVEPLGVGGVNDEDETVDLVEVLWPADDVVKLLSSLLMLRPK